MVNCSSSHSPSESICYFSFFIFTVRSSRLFPLFLCPSFLFRLLLPLRRRRRQNQDWSREVLDYDSLKTLTLSPNIFPTDVVRKVYTPVPLRLNVLMASRLSERLAVEFPAKAKF